MQGLAGSIGLSPGLLFSFLSFLLNYFFLPTTYPKVPLAHPGKRFDIAKGSYWPRPLSAPGPAQTLNLDDLSLPVFSVFRSLPFCSKPPPFLFSPTLLSHPVLLFFHPVSGLSFPSRLVLLSGSRSTKSHDLLRSLQLNKINQDNEQPPLLMDDTA